MKRYFWNTHEGFVVFERDPDMPPHEDHQYKSIRIINKGKELSYHRKDYSDHRDKYNRILAAFLENNHSLVCIDPSTNKFLSYFEELKVSQALSFFRGFFWDKPEDSKDIIPEKHNGGYCVHFQEVDTFIKTHTSRFLSPQDFSSEYDIPRKQEVNRIISQLKNFPLHTVYGDNGMGKSTLAKNVGQAMLAENMVRHIVFLPYAGTLEDTINSIQVYAPPAPTHSTDKLSETISAMKLVAQHEKGLLIIDNYENDKFEDEFSETNETYKELLDAGWYILITSPQRLLGCSYIGENQVTKIERLPLNSLTELFLNISKLSSDRSEEISHLIDKLLSRNTYLVVLSASLAKTEKLEFILQHFESNDVSSLTKPFSTYKDGKQNKNRSLYNHFCSMFSISNIVKSPKYKKLLFNLALLPVSGADRELFFSTAFSKKERAEAEELFENLKDRYLAFEDNSNIYIHHMLKEYIILDLCGFKTDFIEKQILCILDITTYTETYPYWYQVGLSLDKFKEKFQPSLIKACLQTGLAALRDITAQKELSFEYAKKAVTSLNSIDKKALSYEELLILSKAYNICANILPNKNNSPSETDKELMFSTIQNASKTLNHLIASSFVDEKTHKKLLRTLSKLNGNTGAYYIRCKEYKEAMRYHKMTLDERLTWYNENPTPDNELLLAASYKNIGTDYYYLSTEETDTNKKLKLLKKSYNNHTTSLEINEKHLTINHLDTIISLNRAVGSLSTAMFLAQENHINPDTVFENCTKDILCNLLNKLTIATDFLESSEIKNQNEIDNISANHATLLKLADMYGYVTTKSTNAK